MAAVVASAVTGVTAVAVGGVTYLATRLQSRTEHMLWRSQSRLETYLQWLDLAGTAHNTALRALDTVEDDLPEAAAIARAGRQQGEDLLKLLLTLDLHGPAYLADQFRYHSATVVFLFDDIAALSSPVAEETVLGLVARHTECGRQLNALRDEAREALDTPTRRRERFLERLTPEAWCRLNR
ncbi:hypothetical protein [Streptomyces sp. NPDC046727]|uniref:hypothetical protein n=1 Tax=Streptomyces sp. NPDC046727 TaxID=3155373 RepID=UPI0033FB3BCF